MLRGLSPSYVNDFSKNIRLELLIITGFSGIPSKRIGSDSLHVQATFDVARLRNDSSESELLRCEAFIPTVKFWIYTYNCRLGQNFTETRL